MKRIGALAASAALLVSLHANARAAELGGAFPCDPREHGPLPPLLILAENHYDQNSATARELAITEAMRGRWFLALEYGRTGSIAGRLADADADPARSRLFGVEQSLTARYVTLALATRIIEQYQTIGGGAAYVSGLLNGLTHAEDHREQSIRALESGAVADEAAASLLRRALMAPGPIQIAPGEVDAAFDAVDALRVRAASEIRSEYGDARVDEIVAALGPGADPPSVSEALLFELRDRDYALQLASLYCSAALERKPLVGVFGADHAPGLRRFLERWSPSPLPIAIVETKDADGERAARAALAALRN